MNLLKYLVPVFLILFACSQRKLQEPSYDSFRLSYISIGMGSNFTSMQPVFRIEGTEFTYTSEQTSYYKNEQRKTADTICKGSIRPSSIDSIIKLVREVKAPAVYRTNIHVMSGGIHYITVSKDSTRVEFTLHNETHSTAQAIVDILNTYIPANKPKLWLFSLPGNTVQHDTIKTGPLRFLLPSTPKAP